MRVATIHVGSMRPDMHVDSMCVGMHAGMYAGLRVDTCTDMVHTCVQADNCAGLPVNMRANTPVDMCLDMHEDVRSNNCVVCRHAGRHTCRQV